MTRLVVPAHGEVVVRDADWSGDAHAVLSLQDWMLTTPHASGPLQPVVVRDVGVLAQRWASRMRAGVVAVDAALLALRDEQGSLPLFGWDTSLPRPVPVRQAMQGLYAIVDTVPRLRQVLDAGLRLVQLRIKQPADADAAWHAWLRRELQDAVADARDAGATVVVNDHWRVGADVGAQVVHLGQEDLGKLGASGRDELAASGLALGVSSHSMWELCRARALAPASIACGPVWPTTTKDMPWRPQGLDNLAWWSAHAGAPVTAIGGILEPAHVRQAASAGADAVCLVRGLGEEPRRTVPAFQAAFDEGTAARIAPPAEPHPSLEPRA